MLRINEILGSKMTVVSLQPIINNSLLLTTTTIFGSEIIFILVLFSLVLNKIIDIYLISTSIKVINIKNSPSPLF